MADGFYRFQQPGASQFFHQQQNHRQFNRASSPPNPRRPFSNDTPSPSRSPVSHSPAHGAFNMYNHGGHHGQNAIMNGGQHHQRFGMQMPKQAQNHHPHQQQGHHQAQHNQGPQIGHHYNYSSGGLSTTTPHFSHSHMQNGNSDNVHDDDPDAQSEFWQQQIALAEEARAAQSPHWYARHIARDQKGIAYSGGDTADENNVRERHRAVPLSTPEDKRQDWMALDFGGQGLRSLSTALFSYGFLEKLYLNWNALRELPSEIGTLKKLVHLDVSNNKLQALPKEIGMLTNLQKLLISGNQITELPHELGYLYQLKTFGVYENPLAQVYKDKIKQGGAKGLIDFLREDKPPNEEPEPRQWVTVDETTSANQTYETISAISYNILCPLYATKSQYPYVAEKAINWETRKRTILNEIRSYDADIVCLQELDRWNYEEFFRAELSYDGYKGFLAQKSRADTMGEQAKFVDGCGIFWKEKKYICLDQQHFVYGRRAVDRPGGKASADMLNRVWARDDIAVVTFLENRITGSRFIVANSHVFWDPAYKDVKLIQVAVLMEELTKLADKWAKHPPCTNKQVFRFSDAEESDGPPPTPGPSQSYDEGSQIPVLICGDYNSNNSSPVYDLFSQGGLESKHPDFINRNYGSFTDNGVKHPFSLKSAYAGEMRFTNYTPGFLDVLDYIWYSSNSLRLQKILGGVDESYLAKVPGFPNEHFPSDHLALKAEFAVVSKKKGIVTQADFGPGSSSRNRH